MPRSRTKRRPHPRSGNVLVMFAFMVFTLMAMAALVIDIGFARLTQQQMQTAVDSAALEGLRWRDTVPAQWLNPNTTPPWLIAEAGEQPPTPYDPSNLYWQQWIQTATPIARRWLASQMVALTFDDDLNPTPSDYFGAPQANQPQLGAGPVVNFQGGVGDDPTMAAAQYVPPGGTSLYKPYRTSDGKPGLEFNWPNDQRGDMLSGTYMTAVGVEQVDYSRNDFLPDATSGQTTTSAPSFLVRMRRSTEVFDSSGVASNGPSLPFLFARGTMYGRRSANPIQPGMTARATAIADARWTAASTPPYSALASANLNGTYFPPNAFQGVTPFAFGEEFWYQTLAQGVVDETSTQILVSSAIAAPYDPENGSSGPFTIQVDNEQMSVTDIGQPNGGSGPQDSNNILWTVTRGVNMTAPAMHSPGAQVTFMSADGSMLAPIQLQVLASGELTRVPLLYGVVTTATSTGSFAGSLKTSIDEFTTSISVVDEKGAPAGTSWLGNIGLPTTFYFRLGDAPDAASSEVMLASVSDNSGTWNVIRGSPPTSHSASIVNTQGATVATPVLLPLSASAQNRTTMILTSLVGGGSSALIGASNQTTSVSRQPNMFDASGLPLVQLGGALPPGMTTVNINTPVFLNPGSTTGASNFFAFAPNLNRADTNGGYYYTFFNQFYQDTGDSQVAIPIRVRVGLPPWPPSELVLTLSADESAPSTTTFTGSLVGDRGTAGGGPAATPAVVPVVGQLSNVAVVNSDVDAQATTISVLPTTPLASVYPGDPNGDLARTFRVVIDPFTTFSETVTVVAIDDSDPTQSQWTVSRSNPTSHTAGAIILQKDPAMIGDAEWGLWGANTPVNSPFMSILFPMLPQPVPAQYAPVYTKDAGADVGMQFGDRVIGFGAIFPGGDVSADGSHRSFNVSSLAPPTPVAGVAGTIAFLQFPIAASSANGFQGTVLPFNTSASYSSVPARDLFYSNDPAIVQALFNDSGFANKLPPLSPLNLPSGANPISGSLLAPALVNH